MQSHSIWIQNDQILVSESASSLLIRVYEANNKNESRLLLELLTLRIIRKHKCCCWSEKKRLEFGHLLLVAKLANGRDLNWHHVDVVVVVSAIFICFNRVWKACFGWQVWRISLSL